MIKKEKFESILSYHKNSLFYNGLFYPEGSNIAPHTDDEPSSEVSGPAYIRSSYSVLDFSIKKLNELKDGLTIFGNFKVYLNKDYSYYWDAEKKVQTSLPYPLPFTMLDSGTYISKITVIKPYELVMETDLIVSREVKGENFDGTTVRDAYFGNSLHQSSSFTRKFKEYYKVISEERLLHYSDNSDFVEIYSIPEQFDIANGIQNSAREIVYDDTNPLELAKDKDFIAIKTILSLRDITKNERIKH